MLRGPADAAALAGTMFLMWAATLLHSSMVMPMGVRWELPVGDGLRGEVVPDLAVAVDATGRLMFEQQWVEESLLGVRLRSQVEERGTNLTLLMMADRRVPAEVVARLMSLARGAGVREVVMAIRPRVDPGRLVEGHGP